jgi:ribosomal protein L10
MRFLRSVASYRRIDKKRNTDIRQNLKKNQSKSENKVITSELLRKYHKNANLQNPLGNIQLSYHPKGRRERG